MYLFLDSLLKKRERGFRFRSHYILLYSKSKNILVSKDISIERSKDWMKVDGFRDLHNESKDKEMKTKRRQILTFSVAASISNAFLKIWTKMFR